MCLYNIAFLFRFIVTIISLGFTKCSDILNHFLCCLNALAIQNICSPSGNFELRPLGVAMGNAVSVTRV